MGGNVPPTCRDRYGPVWTLLQVGQEGGRGPQAARLHVGGYNTKDPSPVHVTPRKRGDGEGGPGQWQRPEPKAHEEHGQEARWGCGEVQGCPVGSPGKQLQSQGSAGPCGASVGCG